MSGYVDGSTPKETLVTKYDLFTTVETEVNKGLSRVEAIRMLSFFLDEDDPVDPEGWFREKVNNAPL